MVHILKAQWMSRLEESLVKTFYEQQNEQERMEAFEDELTFGTAGIRSKFGLGPGRLNKFTVRKVALGLAQFLRRDLVEPLVVIHYDTRYLSEAFAKEMAKVLATQSVYVIVSNTYKSTPELSFAIRYLKADAGIMITASHNPSDYNGIKIYGREGGQLLPEASEALSTYINAIDSPLNIDVEPMEVLIESGFIRDLPQLVTEQYIVHVTRLYGAIQDHGAHVLLTSLHGTSLPILSHILKRLGFENFSIDEEQSIPDGAFPTCKTANPEDPVAFDHAIKLANKTHAQLIIATDPDADRFGIIERYEDGSHYFFNGNEIGLILMMLRAKELSECTMHKYIVKTIVTGATSEALAQHLGLDSVNVLTGFKYISDQLEKRSNMNQQLVLAYEESHGYLIQDFSRDKDAIQCIPLLVKYKQQLHDDGRTLYDVLQDIYRRVGRFEDLTLSPVYDGKEGRAKIKALMTTFSQYSDTHLCGLKIKTIENYREGLATNIETGVQEVMTLPFSNVIRFTFDEGFIAIRPSGTEPKMKIYFSLKVGNFENVIKAFQQQFL
ncbi:phospho-sugar mutase [Staphylococcus hyicus]|uniref:Phosphoglucomutase n=1 Tax=Staphylococcus hyicus TaxID=1284 RepID=A0A418JIV1_STAHY|nr:phospho-sugar mutase [Staphylococcus hyicus]RIO45725.1 phospho-sugar mutase [Staphylococcus hyicus]